MKKIYKVIIWLNWTLIFFIRVLTCIHSAQIYLILENKNLYFIFYIWWHFTGIVNVILEKALKKRRFLNMNELKNELDLSHVSVISLTSLLNVYWDCRRNFKEPSNYLAAYPIHYNTEPFNSWVTMLIVIVGFLN